MLGNAVVIAKLEFELEIKANISLLMVYRRRLRQASHHRESIFLVDWDEDQG